MPVATSRACTVCKVVKPPEQFYARKDGYLTGPCIPCYRERDNKRQPDYYARNRDKVVEKTRRWRADLRREVLEAYGGACSCCGEDHPEFLALNHIEGGGRKHRHAVGGTAMQVYKFVRDKGFPPEFDLLCHNCNVAYGLYGLCPHQVEE